MRIVERFLSLVLALALIAGSVLLALEVAYAVAGQPPLLVQWPAAYELGNDNQWDTAVARFVAAAVLLVGLLLLLIALKPRRARRLRMTPGSSGVDAAITRRSLRTTLLNTATRVDGISSARAKVSKRRATVTGVSRLGTADTASALTGELDSALRARLDGLQLAKPPRLRTSVSPRRTARSS